MSRAAPVRNVPRSSLVALDGLRGGAALYVVAYHCVDLLTASGRRFHEPGGALRMIGEGNLLGFFGFGYYAVLLFFVLSGFVIHLRQAERPEERRRVGTRAWVVRYAVKRGVRVYVPLLAALVVTIGVGGAGRAWAPDLFGQVLQHPSAAYITLVPTSVSAALDVLVPFRAGAVFGTNGSLWSISYELWFYLLYVPLLTVLMGRLRLRSETVLAGSLLVAAYLAVHGRTTVAVYLPAWLAGAVLAEMHARGRRIRPRPAFAGASLILAAAVGSNNSPTPAIDLLWCIGFLVIMAALLGTRAETGPLAALARCAPWSYSLYLVHMPIILVTYGLLGNGTAPLTDPFSVALCFLASVAAGLALYRCVERPSVRWLGRLRFPPPDGATGLG